MNNEEKILEMLEQISQTLERHGEILEHHSEILERHSEMLERHDKTLERLDHQITKINLTLENDVQQKFDVIFDKLDSIDQRLEELPTVEDQMITNGRLDVLEATVKKLSRDVAALKKAQ